MGKGCTSGWYATAKGNDAFPIGPYESREKCLSAAISDGVGIVYQWRGPGCRHDIRILYAEQAPIKIADLFHVDDWLNDAYYNFDRLQDVDGLPPDDLAPDVLLKDLEKDLEKDVRQAIDTWQSSSGIAVYPSRFEYTRDDEELTIIIPITKSPVEKVRCLLAAVRIRRDKGALDG